MLQVFSAKPCVTCASKKLEIQAFMSRHNLIKHLKFTFWVGDTILVFLHLYSTTMEEAEKSEPGHKG